MLEIIYRSLKLDECEKIKDINASQYIRKAWRDVSGVRQLVYINFQETTLPNGYENHLANLVKTVTSKGIALGAFHQNILVGFCCVPSEFFGESCNYVLLDQLYISNEFRNKGIGKKLFLKSAYMAKNNGANKFYICAGSAQETVAFYFSIGCVEAVEVNKKLLELDSRDYPMEFDFSKL